MVRATLPKLIYHLTFRGFYSEITNMINGYLYAIDKKYPFVLYSKDWIAAYDKGWQDYFMPYCEEESDKRLSYATILPRNRFHHARLNSLDQKLTLAKKRLLHKPYYAQDLFYRFRDQAFIAKQFNIPAHNIDGDIFCAYRAILKEIWRYNTEIDQYINQKVKTLAIPRSFIALHIRRGDKVFGERKEAKLIDVHQYFDQALALVPEAETFFIATDDFTVIEECRRLYRYFNIVTLCGPNEAGHSEASFAVLSAKQRRQATLDLLVDSEVMKRADIFVGSFSSNVGRAMCLFREEHTYSLDERWFPL